MNGSNHWIDSNVHFEEIRIYGWILNSAIE